METRKVVVKLPLRIWKQIKAEADGTLTPVGSYLRQIILKIYEEKNEGKK